MVTRKNKFMIMIVSKDCVLVNASIGTDVYEWLALAGMNLEEAAALASAKLASLILFSTMFWFFPLKSPK